MIIMNEFHSIDARLAGDDTISTEIEIEREETVDDTQPLWLIEKEAIESAITFYEGNILKAAAALEIAPSTIYRKRSAWQNTKS